MTAKRRGEGPVGYGVTSCRSLQVAGLHAGRRCDCICGSSVSTTAACSFARLPSSYDDCYSPLDWTRHSDQEGFLYQGIA